MILRFPILNVPLSMEGLNSLDVAYPSLGSIVIIPFLPFAEDCLILKSLFGVM